MKRIKSEPADAYVTESAEYEVDVMRKTVKRLEGALESVRKDLRSAEDRLRAGRC